MRQQIAKIYAVFDGYKIATYKNGASKYVHKTLQEALDHLRDLLNNAEAVHTDTKDQYSKGAKS